MYSGMLSHHNIYGKRIRLFQVRIRTGSYLPGAASKRELMENTSSNTRHLRVYRFLIQIPDAIIDELEPGDVLEPKDYPGLTYTLTKEDVDFFGSCSGYDNICLSIRRSPITGEYRQDGLFIFSDAILPR